MKLISEEEGALLCNKNCFLGHSWPLLAQFEINVRQSFTGKYNILWERKCHLLDNNQVPGKVLTKATWRLSRQKSFKTFLAQVSLTVCTIFCSLHFHSYLVFFFCKEIDCNKKGTREYNPRILQPLCGVIDFPLIQLCLRWCLEHGDRKPIPLLLFRNIYKK